VQPVVQSILCCNVVSGPNGRNETPNCAAMSLNGSLSNASTNIDENRLNSAVHNYRKSSCNLQGFPCRRVIFEANTLQVNTLRNVIVGSQGLAGAVAWRPNKAESSLTDFYRHSRFHLQGPQDSQSASVLLLFAG
jgi:hypothetical protein